MNKTALVVGASGLIGQKLVRLLVEQPAYAKVTVFVRQPLPWTHQKLNQQVVDFEQLASYASHFQVDEVHCCLGTTIKVAKTAEAFTRVDRDYPIQVAELAKQHGVQQMLIVSAIATDPNSTLLYSRVKGEMEQAVSRIGIPSLHIIKPSLLLGTRNEFRFFEFLSQKIAPLFGWAFIAKMNMYRPIKADDVALAMVNIAQQAKKGTHTYTYQQLIDVIQ